MTADVGRLMAPVAELRAVLREELQVQHLELSVKQAQAQQEQHDRLLATVERLLQQQSRQIGCRLDVELRRFEALLGIASGGKGAAVARGCSSETAASDLCKDLGRRRSGPSQSLMSSRSMPSSTTDEVEVNDQAALPFVAPPVARSVSPQRRSNASLQLPAAAVRPCGPALLRAAMGGQSPAASHHLVSISAAKDYQVRCCSSSDGGSEDEVVPNEWPQTARGDRSTRSMRWDLRSGSPRSGRLSIGPSEAGISDYRSEATQQNDKERHQWRHHVRQQITRRLSDINSQSAIANTVSGLLGLQSHLSTIRRTRTEATLNERPVAKESKSKLERFVDSPAFNLACGLIIVVNAVFIGVETDLGIRGALAVPPWEPPFWTSIVNQVFVVLFVVEVVIRLVAKSWRFFVAEDWKWNVFDLVLSAYAAIEEWAMNLEMEGGFSLTYTRLVKGFRMVRVLRVIRMMRFFRELRLMVCSTMKCIVSLSWAMVLMTVIIYLFTVCFMHAATVYLRDGRHLLEGGDKVREELQMFYGSLPTAMFSLLMAVSGGDDWINFVTPLGEIHWLYKVLFSIYIVFVVIGVVNVVTSAFVQRACELSRLDRDLAIQSEMVSQEAWTEEMKGIFEEVDSDNSGQITWDKFREFMENVHVQAYFATQQLDTSDARELFTLLDTDGNGSVCLEEFIMGCQKLRGQAKSSDVATLLRENKRTSRKFMRSLRKMEMRVSAICNSLGLDTTEFSTASFLRSPSAWGTACTPASTLALSPTAAIWRSVGQRSSRMLGPRSKSAKACV